jgi:predicted PurR-regulated permease PerM
MQPLREDQTLVGVPRVAGQAPSKDPPGQSELHDSVPSRLYLSLSRPLWILAICALVAGLRASRQALIPLVLAILLALTLSGVVEALRRMRIPRAVSAALLLALGGAAIGGTLDALWTPAQQWVQNAPRVMRVIERRVRPAQAVMQRLNDLATRASAIAGAGPDSRTTAPVNSTPAPPAPQVTAVELLTDTGWLVGAVVTVAVLTLFLLSAGPPALARMMAALGGNVQATHVMRTIDAIRVEVGRYYGTLALVNLSLGTATAVTMWSLHMPNPVLWGAMAATLNFIPYLGSAVTLMVVSVVALVTFDSIAHVLLVSASYLGLATIEGQIIEPIFFGRRLQINPVVVFIALWLGGWLWGIAGVVLAVPVLLAIKVAAARGGGGVVLRFLGPAISSVEVSEAPRRVQAPAFLGGGRKPL